MSFHFLDAWKKEAHTHTHEHRRQKATISTDLAFVVLVCWHIGRTISAFTVLFTAWARLSHGSSSHLIRMLVLSLTPLPNRCTVPQFIRRCCWISSWYYFGCRCGRCVMIDTQTHQRRWCHACSSDIEQSFLNLLSRGETIRLNLLGVKRKSVILTKVWTWFHSNLSHMAAFNAWFER